MRGVIRAGGVAATSRMLALAALRRAFLRPMLVLLRWDRRPALVVPNRDRFRKISDAAAREHCGVLHSPRARVALARSAFTRAGRGAAGDAGRTAAGVAGR